MIAGSITLPGRQCGLRRITSAHVTSATAAIDIVAIRSGEE